MITVSCNNEEKNEPLIYHEYILFFFDSEVTKKNFVLPLQPSSAVLQGKSGEMLHWGGRFFKSFAHDRMQLNWNENNNNTAFE